MLACMNGYLIVAEFLLEQGSDMTVINKVRIYYSILALFMKQRYINALDLNNTST